MVRDMRNRAILNRDTTSRQAYLQRRNFRAKKDNEIATLRQGHEAHKSEVAELKDQIAELAKVVEKLAKLKKPKKDE